MKSTMRAIVVALAVVMVAGWAAAQGLQQQSQQPTAMQHGMQPGAGQYQPVLYPADQLLSMQIKNNQGQTLGSLEDIVLEPGLNYVAYGVLSRGGVLGMGQNYFAIPWDVLQIGSDRQNLILNIPEQAFEQAQGFNKDRWPDRADQRWRMQAMGQQPMAEQPMSQQQPVTPAPSGQSWRDQQLREQQQWRQQEEQPQAMSREQQRSSGQVYGRPLPEAQSQSRQWQTTPESDSQKWSQQPPTQSQQWGQTPQGRQRGSQQAAAYGGAKEGFNFRRVSQLLGLNVETFAAQEKVGDLKNIVLDFQQGLVAYGIIGLEGNRSAPVPWSAIEIQPMNKIALLDATPQTLDQVAYQGDQLPDLSDPQYAQNIHSVFNREPYWEVLGFVGGPQTQQQRMQQHQPMQQQRMLQPTGQQQEPLTRHFDPQNITVVSGTVQSIGTFDEPGLGIQGQRLRIKTDDGQTVSVHAGPGRFLEQQGLMLRRNEQVQVRGSFANINGRSIFIASDIRTPQAEVQLRDQQGTPLWGAMSSEQQQQQQW